LRKNKNPTLMAGTPQTGAKFQKFWNMASVSEDEGEITLYGDVMSQRPIDWWTGEPVPGLYITPEGFLEDLEVVKNKSKITIKLNSCGGDLYTGIAIHNALKGLTGTKTVIVEGIAASAASVIMCAGDDVQVYPGSMVMIHGVAGLMYDYYTIADLKQVLKGFDAAEKAIAEIYKAKTGTDTEALRSMMTKETWMVGQEAIDKGFANTMLDGEGPDMVMSADRKILLVAGVRHDIKAFHNIPGSIPVAKSSIPPATPAAGVNKKPTSNGGVNQEGGNPIMKTVEELKQAYPELVAQIEQAAGDTARAEAVKAERERIKAIESIEASVGDAQLVADAKYGENPCNAQDLAFKAMQKQAQLGTQHLANTQQDAAASGAKDVSAQPNGGSDPKDSANDEAELATIVNAYKQTKGGKK
jgi:ATP-dependent Clp protease protease subunit